MDGLVGVQWREVGVHFTIILSNVETVGVHVLTAGRNHTHTSQQDDSNETDEENMPDEDQKYISAHLSLGSLPSLVYCQQMSPIRSWTRALAMVTTVIGCSFS